jgi:hypothetical protein
MPFRRCPLTREDSTGQGLAGTAPILDILPLDERAAASARKHQGILEIGHSITPHKDIIAWFKRFMNHAREDVAISPRPP